MGYTNYYRTPIKMDAKKFKLLSEELKVAAGFLPGTTIGDLKYLIVLRGWDGTGKPEFTNEAIAFNGDNQDDLSHETFRIDRDNTKQANARGSKESLVFNCCKTARKPYDLMVQISLLRLKHHFPETIITSDGRSTDWVKGRKVYKKIFGDNPPKMNR